ncbi:MAG: hypothetical protein ACKN89_09830, partial [Cyanobium sp.]
ATNTAAFPQLLPLDWVVSYQFTIGSTSGEPIQPALPAAPPFAIKADGDIFVNTGSQFFNQYIYLYNDVHGQVSHLDRQTLAGHPFEELNWLADSFNQAAGARSPPPGWRRHRLPLARQRRHRLRRASSADLA